MDQQERLKAYLDSKPLMLFSLYTDTQFNMVKVLGEEIVQCMDETISMDEKEQVRITARGKYTDEAYSKFWFWTLGAYEVIRTMCRAEKCFSSASYAQLKNLKTELEVVRVPLQSKSYEENVCHAELSIYAINGSPPDYKYRVKDEIISTRKMIGRFNDVVGGISRSDVLGDFRSMYPAMDC